MNGPVVGISFTILGLFDMVIASDKATFSAPFTKIGLSPEGCSSYTFPKIMGPIRVNIIVVLGLFQMLNFWALFKKKAADLLLFNRKLTADEAFQYGLLTEVISDQSFEVKSTKRLEIISKLPREVFKWFI